VTLSDRIAGARKGLRDLADRRVLEKEATLFELRATQFSEPSRRLRELASCAEVLSGDGIRVEGLDRAWLEQLRLRLTSLRDAFEESAPTILDPTPNEDARFLVFQPLDKLPAAVEGALKASWNSWIVEQSPPITEDVLVVLIAVSALRDTVSQIQRLRNQVRQWANTLPASAAVVATVRATCEEIRRAWELLAGGDLPEEVVTFLRAAGRDGAPYTMLTPATEAWLRQNRLLDTLKVRLS